MTVYFEVVLLVAFFKYSDIDVMKAFAQRIINHNSFVEILLNLRTVCLRSHIFRESC